MKENIKPATGRLGVLVVGVGGAVATTMITGTLAARKGLAKAIGSINTNGCYAHAGWQGKTYQRHSAFG